MRTTLTWLMWLLTVPLLGGCDDTIFGKTGSTDSGGSYADGYEGVVAITGDHCISCHPSGGGSGGLDLESDLCGNTVGVPAQDYDGDLVVAGDHASSVLWAKMADTGEYGGVMPLGGGLSSDVVAIVEAWIDDGASCN